MKTEIIFGMLLTILNKKCVTANELAHKYLVSTRTIYRYLEVLDLCNIPIITKSGRNGGISILNTFTLHNMFFTMQEKYTLITLCSNIENIQLRDNIQTKLLNL